MSDALKTQCGCCSAWTRLRCYLCDDCKETLLADLDRLDRAKSRVLSEYVQKDVRGESFDRTQAQRIEKIEGYIKDVGREASAWMLQTNYMTRAPQQSPDEMLLEYRTEVANLCSRKPEGPGIALALHELLDSLSTEAR